MVLFSSMLVVVAIINFFVDPGTVYFKKVSRSSLISLYTDTLASSQYGMRQEGWNERDVKLELAKRTGEIECIILGSSHVMSISIHNIEGLKKTCGSVMNLGVSGFSIEDLAIFTGILLKSTNIVENKKVIIGIDPWTLNFNRDFRYTPYIDSYYNLTKKVGFTIDNDEEAKDSKYNTELFSNLISFDYFNESLSLIKKDGFRSMLSQVYDSINIYKERKAYVYSQVVPKFSISNGWEVAVTLPDGGHVNSSKYVAEAARKKHPLDAQKYKIIEGEWFDNNAIDLFSRIVLSLKKYNFEVIILITPYHPNIWHKSSGEVSRKAMHLVFERLSALTHQLDIKLLGSYQPQVVGCDSDEFFDFMHARSTCLNKIWQDE